MCFPGIAKNSVKAGGATTGLVFSYALIMMVCFVRVEYCQMPMADP